MDIVNDIISECYFQILSSFSSGFFVFGMDRLAGIPEPGTISLSEQKTISGGA
ncbi:MAG: hypothetical protein GX147_08940 [Deltaproteobacteria bacterium]|nr:hypothetical protein [Deltaproteobacteria bacterium]